MRLEINSTVYRYIVCSIVSVFIIHVVKESQEEVEQLQRELEQRQKMGRARDVIISNLEQEKGQILNVRPE